MKQFSILLVTLALVASGCVMQESLSGDAYSRSGARSGNMVRMGTIVSIEEVLIEGDGGAAGGIGGAVVGGAAGRMFGGGRASILTTAVGAVGGAVAGSAIEHKITQKKGLEITVKYAGSDECEAIVQEPGKDQFMVGQAIRVLTDKSSGVKRVRPVPQQSLTVVEETVVSE